MRRLLDDRHTAPSHFQVAPFLINGDCRHITSLRTTGVRALTPPSLHHRPFTPYVFAHRHSGHHPSRISYKWA
ncbi:hypothetical protein HanIR_Chr13g0629541 [Helianthus annuus]|nr:hypothetical protein HanIR_Chr13g0629541 [Helianthus annuus]